MVGYFIHTIIRYIAHINSFLGSSFTINIIYANSVLYDDFTILHVFDYFCINIRILCDDCICIFYNWNKIWSSFNLVIK